MRPISLLLSLAVLFCGTCMAQKTLGDIGVGYEYLNAQGAHEVRSSYQGWNAQLIGNLTKSVSVLFDSSNFYDAPNNLHSLTAGPLYKFPKWKKVVTPNVFAEIGETRASVMGAVSYSFEFETGFGFSVALNKHVALNVVPGDYVVTFPSGGPRNNYLFIAGLLFPFGHKK